MKFNGVWSGMPGSYILCQIFFFQFFLYFFYFTLLTVVYLGCAAWVIMRHYRNQRQEQVPTEATTPIELSPVEQDPSEKKPLSNGSNVRTWKLSEFYSVYGEVISLRLFGFSLCPPVRFLWITVHSYKHNIEMHFVLVTLIYYNKDLAMSVLELMTNIFTWNCKK